MPAVKVSLTYTKGI